MRAKFPIEGVVRRIPIGAMPRRRLTNFFSPSMLKSLVAGKRAPCVILVSLFRIREDAVAGEENDEFLLRRQLIFFDVLWGKERSCHGVVATSRKIKTSCGW